MTIRRAAIVTTVQPYPTDNGKRVVLAGFLRYLRERLGDANVHYIHVGDRLDPHPDFGDVVIHEVGRPTRAELARGLTVGAGLQGRSLQEAVLRSPTVTERVQRILREVDADLEIVDTLRMDQYVRGQLPRGRRVHYLDDLFSTRYERMRASLDSDEATAGFDPLGNFATFVPRKLRWMTRSRPLSRHLLALEGRRVHRSETRLAERSDLALLLNADEAEALRGRSGGRVETIPPWLSPPEVSPATWDGAPVFTFVGHLGIAHNTDGLGWFLRTAMPPLLEQRPDARLHVVGRRPKDELAAEAAPFGDRVVLHGFVPDVGALLQSSCATISPLRFGSGVKIKTLEALARGVPVVGTGVAAEGITGHSRPSLTIVEDGPGFADCLVRLLDPGIRAAASEDATRMFHELYADEVVRQAYHDLFGTGT